jgi:hypothetical protein
MWKLNRRWWLISAALLVPGAVMLVAGIANPGARSDDGFPLAWMGASWLLMIGVTHAGIFLWLGRQKKRIAYFQENGLRGEATILQAETTGTFINDMPQIELRLEVVVPGRQAYAVTDRRCWNPLTLAGLQRGAKLPVLVDPRNPQRLMFVGG